MAWGTTTPQPAWLARPLPLSTGMRLWHESAASDFGATPPAVRMHTPDAGVSGPPTFGPPRLRSRAAECLILRDDPPRRRSL
jgi:hypothetical protein